MVNKLTGVSTEMGIDVRGNCITIVAELMAPGKQTQKAGKRNNEG